MFYIMISIINFVGWFSYYYFSGGIFEYTETEEVKALTIGAFAVVSIISLIVGVIFRNRFNGFIANVANSVVGTALFTALIGFCVCGELYWTERIFGVGLIVFLIIIYFVLFFFWKERSFVFRLLIFLILCVVMLAFVDTDVAEYGLGCGLTVGGIPSVLNGIYNHIKYEN